MKSLLFVLLIMTPVVPHVTVQNKAACSLCCVQGQTFVTLLFQAYIQHISSLQRAASPNVFSSNSYPSPPPLPFPMALAFHFYAQVYYVK